MPANINALDLKIHVKEMKESAKQMKEEALQMIAASDCIKKQACDLEDKFDLFSVENKNKR